MEEGRANLIDLRVGDTIYPVTKHVKDEIYRLLSPFVGRSYEAPKPATNWAEPVEEPDKTFDSKPTPGEPPKKKGGKRK